MATEALYRMATSSRRATKVTLFALVVASASGQPVGTVRKGTCGVFTDEKGFPLPAGPGVILPNGHCKTDPRGWYPHTATFEACVARIKSNNCTMAHYISWGGFNIHSAPILEKADPFESMCAWFSECDFAHLCVDCTKDSGPQCPTTKWSTHINFTSTVVAPWKPPPGPPPKPGPSPPKPPPKPSPPGPVKPGMIYNGTCLPSPGNGGDCNLMRAGTFNDPANIKTLDDCVARVKKCKYGNYATFTNGANGCNWFESCPYIGTSRFCVDCSKPVRPNGQCADLKGKCPGFIQFMTEVIAIGPPAHPVPNYTCSSPDPSPPPPPPSPPAPLPPPPPASGTQWEHVGPWNIFDDKDNKGEAGTLQAAASPKANPNLIYTGGNNNGGSSGILKSVDGGIHWTRNSRGLWDTHIWGIFIHPSDPMGSHVIAGTGSGIYESKDAAATWQIFNETVSWGNVWGFKEASIGGNQYIIAKTGQGVVSLAVSGGTVWQKTKSNIPISMSRNDLYPVTTAGVTEIVECIVNGWTGNVRYGTFKTSTEIEWSDPINYTAEVYDTWFLHSSPRAWNHRSYDITCSTNTTCEGHWHYVGHFDNVTDCEIAVNSTDLGFKPAGYVYKGSLCPSFNRTEYPHMWPPPANDQYWYSHNCYASDNFDTFTPPYACTPSWTCPISQQPCRHCNQSESCDVGQSFSGRGPGKYPVNSTAIKCFQAAVDPNDRNHIIMSVPGSNSNWASFDGGATIVKNTKTHEGAFYVAIDSKGWSYQDSQGGAYVTRDNGTTWDKTTVRFNGRNNTGICNSTETCSFQRDVHDYQGINVGFRGDTVAFPSDQGLFILNGSSNNLTNLVGDMHNNLALSALISPSKDGKSRNIVVNLWDWNQAFSVDDGATWRGWAATEAAPYACGEGGWGYTIGTSGYVNMFHHNNWWHSSDGGYNFVQNTFPGSGGLSFAYVRQAGSLVEPTGTVFTLMKAPAGPEGDPFVDSKNKKEREHLTHLREKNSLTDPNHTNYPGITVPPDPDAYIWLLTSENFGLNWTYAVLPDKLQTCGDIGSQSLAVDPTKPNSLYVLFSHCLAHSANNGKNWTSCIIAPGLEGPFNEIIVKDSQTMFITRIGLVPLKTVDGGATWRPMQSLALAFRCQAGNHIQCPTFSASLSWTGKTLVIHGIDRIAKYRQEFGTLVWKSTDDGETWTDETGDLVSMTPGHGVWYESDFYLTTFGEGVVVKRNFE